MTSQPPDQPSKKDKNFRGGQRSFLLALYALVTIFVLMLTIFLSIRALSPQPQMIPTILPESGVTPSSTPLQSATLTASPTLRSTFTPKPSSTPSITPTPTSSPTATLPPSLTPAFPIVGNQYDLVQWTPELADQLIELMQAYPRTLSAFARGEDDSGFYEAFQYAVFAQREALLQFPTAPQADQWSWDLAFNLARTGDAKAVGAYALLITNELNQGEIDISNLPSWVNGKVPRIDIAITPLESTPGSLSKNIVKISSQGNGGALFLLREAPDNFESFPLTSKFDFIHQTSVDFIVEALTNEGNQEIVIYRSTIPGAKVYEFPQIFSVSGLEPEELFFEPVQPPEVSPDLQVQWQPVEDVRSEADLKFIDTLFPACPVRVQHLYRWNGQSFEFLAAIYEVEPSQDLLNFCEFVVNHAFEAWGPGPTIQIMETILPLWPPERTVEGEPYPEDALDQWRYRLGIYHALEGNIDQAKEYMQGITVNPAISASRWINPATDFLAIYQQQRDIYRACITAEFCDPREAIRALVTTLSSEDYTNALQVLSDAGLLIRSAGFFDFDDDGTSERWLILRPSQVSKQELWILLKTINGVEALFVGQVQEKQPRITFVQPVQEPPVVQLGDETTFILQQAPAGADIKRVAPMRVFSVDLTQEKLDAIESQLLGGADPEHMRQELVNLEGSSFFTCNFVICPKFHYLLGLASELAGKEPNAVDAYLALWQDFPRSPFATMARLKLEGIIATPTPSPSPTRTPTVTPTTTATPTPTQIGTISGTPTTTASISPSATPVEGYPPPAPTDTPGSGYP